MALTHSSPTGRDQCFQQIDKLINSHSLRSSESLCKLLRYLAEHSLDHPGVPLKEYQIATEVLGRSARIRSPERFDRPRAGRPPAGEVGGVLLPRRAGRYYRCRVAEGTPTRSPSTCALRLSSAARSVVAAAESSKRDQQIARSFEPRLADRGCGPLGFAGGRIATSAILLWHSRARRCEPSKPCRPLTRYSGIVSSTGPQQPLVIFSNGSFVGRPETGMRYFNASADARRLHPRSLHRRGRSTGGPSTRPRLRSLQPAASREAR